MGNVLANRNAEIAVIGALLRGAQCDLVAEDFTDHQLRAVFTAIENQRLDSKPVDLVSIDTATGNQYTDLLIEAGGQGIPSLVQHHARMVRECSTRRRAGDLARDLYKAITQPFSEPDAVIEDTRRKLLDLMGGERQEWTSAAELAKATHTWLEALSKGEVQPVGTGIRTLDGLIGGLYPGELTIVGAKPGVGKTVFGMVAALEAAKLGKRVGVMNLEMLDSQYGTRIIANLGGVNAMNLRKGTISQEEWADINQAMATLSKMPAAFMFKSRYIEDLRAAVRNRELDLLIVDYMQLMRTRQNFESERLRMGHVSWALKELAIENRIPVVVMSQLRRPDANSVDKMPTMRDLRETGNIEADADGIILLHEPASTKDPYVYQDDKQGFETWKKQGLRYIAMKVEKQRQGQIGTVSVLFDGAQMRYREIVRKL